MKVTMVVVDLSGDRDRDDGEGGGRRLWCVVVRCMVLVDLWWRRWCGDRVGDTYGGMVVVVVMKGGRSWPKKSRQRELINGTKIQMRKSSMPYHDFVDKALDIRKTRDEAAISEMEIVWRLDSGFSGDALETLFVTFGGVATLNLDLTTTWVAPNLLDFAATGEVNKALFTLEFDDKA
nr:hypothetical protein [Tanacetum cinerariifolium]